MKRRSSLLISLALCGTALLSAGSAAAAPVFRNAGAEAGFHGVTDVLRILPDSSRGGAYYLLPASLSDSLKPALGPVFPKLKPPLFKSQLNPHTTRYAFLLVPNIGLLEAAVFYAQLSRIESRAPTFKLRPLDCRTKSLDLDGVPRALMSAVRSNPVALHVRELGLHGDLPEGFAQRVIVTTAASSAPALESAILALGARGTLALGCDGYAAGADTRGAPREIDVAIPIDAQFRGVNTNNLIFR
ncbi:hypothetical protein [Sorangium sp. So ce542]|uniref:hypothetical protein n=1 Tax=Sorangium sp. So ce542 TaxID=3133316 RepID=UPI003F62B9E9